MITAEPGAVARSPCLMAGLLASAPCCPYPHRGLGGALACLVYGFQWRLTLQASSLSLRTSL